MGISPRSPGRVAGSVVDHKLAEYSQSLGFEMGEKFARTLAEYDGLRVRPIELQVLGMGDFIEELAKRVIFLELPWHRRVRIRVAARWSVFWLGLKSRIVPIDAPEVAATPPEAEFASGYEPVDMTGFKELIKDEPIIEIVHS